MNWWRAKAKKHTGFVYFQATEHMSGHLAALKIFGVRYVDLEQVRELPDLQPMGEAKGIPIFSERY